MKRFRETMIANALARRNGVVALVPWTPSAAFTFVNPPSSGTWSDSAGTTLTATISGTPTYTAAFGGGLTMVDASTYITINATNPNTDTSFTISMAANFPSSSAGYTVTPFNGGSATGDVYATIRVANGWAFGCVGGTQGTGVPYVSTGLAWWDFVYNGTTNTIYVYKNGDLFSSGPPGIPNKGWSSTMLIGLDRSGNPSTSATFYQIRYGSTDLSQASITTQYNSIKSIYGLP